MEEAPEFDHLNLPEMATALLPSPGEQVACLVLASFISARASFSAQSSVLRGDNTRQHVK